MNRQNTYAKQCIISAFGRDVIGLVGLLSSMVTESGGNIVDIVEHVTHGYFNIFIVVDLEKSTIAYSQLVKQLQSTANQTGLHLVVEPADFNLSPNLSSKLILMILLGPDRPGIVSRLSFLAGNYGINLEQMRMIARGDLFAMEVLADTSACAQPFTKIRSEIKKQLRTIGIEVVFQTKNIYSRSKRLIVFDVDGNAFSSSFAETTNTNLPAIGFQPKVLAGLSINLIRRLASECRPSFATVELVRTLQMMGYRVALLSSGLEPFLSSLAAQLGVDYILGNKLDIRGKKVTGSLIKPLVTHKKQQEYINKIRRQERLQSGEVVVIGKEKPGIPKSGLNFRYQGVLVNTAIANGDLRPEQAASIAAQFQTSKPVKKEV